MSDFQMINKTITSENIIDFATLPIFNASQLNGILLDVDLSSQNLSKAVLTYDTTQENLQLKQGDFTNYIYNENQLTLDVTTNRWILDIQSKYIFGDPTSSGTTFILTKGFLIPTSGTMRLSAIKMIIYLGTGELFYQPSITSQLILSMDFMTFAADIPTSPSFARTCFNLTGTGASTARPVLLLNYCQFLFWGSLGTLTGFDTIQMSNIALRVNNGTLTISNLVGSLSIQTASFSNYLNTGKTFITFSGTGSPGIFLGGINFIPKNTEYAFLIADTLTPNLTAYGNTETQTFITIPAERFFNPTSGLTQTSIYINAAANNHIRTSTISAELRCITLTQTDFNLTMQWSILNIDTITETNMERITSSTQVLKMIGLEPSNIVSNIQINLRALGGDKNISINLIFLGTAQSVSVDNTTDTLTDVAHGLSSGDLVCFFDTSIGNLPGGVSNLLLYWVDVLTADTFQLHNNVGLSSLVNITSNGTSVMYAETTLSNQLFTTGMSSTLFGIISTSGIVSLTTNTRLAPVVRNDVDFDSIECNNFYFRLH